MLRVAIGLVVGLNVGFAVAAYMCHGKYTGVAAASELKPTTPGLEWGIQLPNGDASFAMGPRPGNPCRD